jgi:hypothetical protein
MNLFEKRKYKIYAAFFFILTLPLLSTCIFNKEAKAMSSNVDPLIINISIDTKNGRSPISPYIYGINGTPSKNQLTAKACRLGGNRTTGYNWENNFSSAGQDWHHYNDLHLVPKDKDSSIPGITILDFVNKAKNLGAYALITLPMAGYAANDGNGAVDKNDTAPSKRFVPVKDRKNGALSLKPNLSDGAVYSDELVNYLIAKLGNSRNGGIRGYSLDNEPALWYRTHPRIHPIKTNVAEILEKSISLSSVVKDFDSEAEVFGPALYGVAAYVNFQSAPDWYKYSASYKWFIDAYLDGMCKAGAENGRRMLDVLDVHYYTEARSPLNHRVSEDRDTNEECIYTRFQSTRSLWDKTYREKSWIEQNFGKFLPILPSLNASIEQYYPGTKLAVSEYNFGGEDHVSGGIAQADALGIFASQGVYYAAFWPMSEKLDYIYSGINLYTNYDGKNGAFGNTLVGSSTNDIENSSVYASISEDGALHVILLNKNIQKPEKFIFTVNSDARYTNFVYYGFNAGSSAIKKIDSGVIGPKGANGFSIQIMPMSAVHLVFTL